MDEKMVSLRINDIPVTVPEGSTVLEAARSAGFNIPSLCFLKDINEIGACRICVVEVKGAKSLVASCVYPVAEGMEVYTNTERVRKSRQLTLELILSNHRMDCLTCSRNSHCELLQLAGDLGIDAVRYANDNMPPQIEASAPHLVRDNSKCVLCRRCTAVCRKTQEVGVIGPNDRGFHTHIGCAFDRDLAEVDCVSCGQCIVACPTGALSEKDDTARVLAALNDPAKHVVVGPAPSIRVTLGECFGLPIGTNVEGKMVTALRRLGFDKVFDVDTAADFTILEEGTEFLSRLNGGGTLPLITSCSPAGCGIWSSTPPTCSATSPPASPPSRCSAPWSRPTTPSRRASIPRTSSWCPSCPAPPRSTRYCGRSSGCPTAACRWTCPSPPGSWAA